MANIAVVIPAFRVRQHVLSVIERIDAVVTRIFVVDDCCPDGSGRFVVENCRDPRVEVIFNEINLGVGGAVMRGYQEAINSGAEVIVKVDGDGQMDPALISEFVAPILDGSADYTKGNRFFELDNITEMPSIRIFGNAALSFLTKLSSGYWDLFDPTNGYTAIHVDVARHLPFKKISNRYFFETDMLFRLNMLRAVVVDVPMDAKYGDEKSNLSISKILGEFMAKHARNFVKRIFYNYYLRDMSVASFEMPIGALMVAFGIIFGIVHWVHGLRSGLPTPVGTIMLSVLPIIVGIQFVLAFLAYDIASTPRRPIHRKR